MGLVQDCDVIGQGLEAYHGHRVASECVHGKVLNWIKRDFSAAKCLPTSSDSEDVCRDFPVCLRCRVDTTQRDLVER